MSVYKEIDKLTEAHFGLTGNGDLIYFGPGDLDDAVAEADRTVGDDNIVFYIDGEEALKWQSELPKLIANKDTTTIGIDSAAGLHGLGSPNSMEEAHEIFQDILTDYNRAPDSFHDWWWVTGPESKEEQQWLNVIDDVISPHPIEKQLSIPEVVKEIFEQLNENRMEDKESNYELMNLLSDARNYSTTIHPNAVLMQAIAMFKVVAEPHPQNYVMSKDYQTVYNDAVSVSITNKASTFEPLIYKEFKALVDTTKKLTAEFNNNSNKLEF